MDSPSWRLRMLLRAVRAHVLDGVPCWAHRLPWIVYAAELGYLYSGDEYWQTFEKKTPGWLVHGDRYWIRKCFWTSRSTTVARNQRGHGLDTSQSSVGRSRMRYFPLIFSSSLPRSSTTFVTPLRRTPFRHLSEWVNSSQLGAGARRHASRTWFRSRCSSDRLRRRYFVETNRLSLG